MRHGKHGRKFGRKAASRDAMFSNMVSSLIEEERIKTTDAKAKELRRLVECTISWATSVGRLTGDAAEKTDAADKARVVHAMRMAARVVKRKPALDKLFNVVGPRFVGRAGGYTRIMKLGYRHGDAAPISIIELVERSVEETPADPQGKGDKSKKAEPPKAAAAKAKPAKSAAPKADKPKPEAKPEKKQAAAAKSEKAEKKPAKSESKPAKKTEKKDKPKK
jgi:large subunit ribosomal protein L17